LGSYKGGAAGWGAQEHEHESRTQSGMMRRKKQSKQICLNVRGKKIFFTESKIIKNYIRQKQKLLGM